MVHAGKIPRWKICSNCRNSETCWLGNERAAQTTVDLNYVSGSQSSAEILTFVGEPSEPDAMNVGINWSDPTHLELTYKGHPTIEFQAVKCRGVDIVTRELDGAAVR
jgi:hypothetical protein